MGYETLSPPARAVAELVELMVLYDIQFAKYSQLPALGEPIALAEETAKRYMCLNQSEQDAVVDLLRQPHELEANRWKSWLAEHLAKFPADAEDLFLLANDFGGGFRKPSWHIFTQYGAFDRPWRMDHSRPYGPPAIATREERLATLTPGERQIFDDAALAFSKFEAIMDERTGKKQK